MKIKSLLAVVALVACMGTTLQAQTAYNLQWEDETTYDWSSSTLTAVPILNQKTLRVENADFEVTTLILEPDVASGATSADVPVSLKFNRPGSNTASDKMIMSWALYHKINGVWTLYVDPLGAPTGWNAANTTYDGWNTRSTMYYDGSINSAGEIIDTIGFTVSQSPLHQGTAIKIRINMNATGSNHWWSIDEGDFVINNIIPPPDPAPIKLADFSGQLEGNAVNLSWTTASELNNSHFIIEKSMDMVNFEQIGTVAGSGNSLENVTYNFTDNNPAAGTVYYRLTQVDFDGKSETFPVIAVEVSAKNVNIVAGSDDSHLFIELESGDNKFYTAQIFDLTGKMVVSKEGYLSQGFNKIRMDVNVASQILIVKFVSGNNQIVTKKISLQ